MDKGKAGTDDAKNQFVRDRGGIQKNVNAGLRSPIARFHLPISRFHLRNCIVVNGKIQVTCR